MVHLPATIFAVVVTAMQSAMLCTRLVCTGCLTRFWIRKGYVTGLARMLAGDSMPPLCLVSLNHKLERFLHVKGIISAKRLVDAILEFAVTGIYLSFGCH